MPITDFDTNGHIIGFLSSYKKTKTLITSDFYKRKSIMDKLFNKIEKYYG